MCCKTIFIVTVMSIVISLVAAQNRPSSQVAHLPVQASYEEPLKRVDITHVEVDVIYSVTLPPSHHQFVDLLQQPSTTSHLQRVVYDETNNANIQKNVNRRQEFNDRNLNNESDNNNNKYMLSREPVRRSDTDDREWEKQVNDQQRNQIRETARTSQYDEARRYDDANKRNKGFEREPERVLEQGNGFTMTQTQRTNNFERGREYGANIIPNQGINRDQEEILHQTTNNNRKTDSLVDRNEISNQDLHRVKTSDHVNRRQEFNDRNLNNESDNNNNKYMLSREPVRRSDTDDREWEKQVNDQQRNQIRETARTSQYDEARRYDDANKRNKGFEREPERVLEQGNGFTMTQTQRTNNFERGREYGANIIPNQGINRDQEEILHQTTNNNRKTDSLVDRNEISNQDLHRVKTSDQPQIRETTYEINNNRRELVSEPVREREFGREREYEGQNKLNQNFDRGSQINNVRVSTFNREVLNPYFNMMEAQKPYRDLTQNNDILYGGNNKNRNILIEPTRANDFSQARNYEEVKSNIHQSRDLSQNREFEQGNNNKRREEVREPVRDTEYDENFNRATELRHDSDRASDPYRQDVEKTSRDRSQNSKIVYGGNNKNKNIINEPIRFTDINADSYYERPNSNNQDLHKVENRERQQNSRREIVTEPVKTYEYNRESAYEENLNRGSKINNDRDNSFNRAASDRHEVLNQDFNMRDIQKPDRDQSQNSEILYGGNNQRQSIVIEPIRANNFNQDRNYGSRNSNNQGFDREPERYTNGKNDRETDSHNKHNEAPKTDTILMDQRERPPNGQASYTDSNKNQKLVSTTGLDQERDYEQTNQPKKDNNRMPERKRVQDSSFNTTPDHRVDRNDVLKQDLKNNERPKVKQSPQKAKASPKTQQEKTPRMCERKYSEYIERIYSNDDETTADANDSEFDGRVLAAPGEYPHMTALGFKQDDKSIDYKCGGSLISENFVITAAHCTNFTGEVPTIARIGDINLMKDEKQLEPQMFRIRKIHVHPEYDGITHYNDIALLQLNASVEFTEFVRPIRLWSHADLPITVAFAMGYGATSFARAPTQQLTNFNMTIIANDVCNERLPRLDEAPHGIVESLICAEDLLMHRDTCQGDSGGPLQYNIRGRRRKNRIHYQLIGITSFGLLCRSPNPGVYTRIYSFLDWIESIVWLE